MKHCYFIDTPINFLSEGSAEKETFSRWIDGKGEREEGYGDGWGMRKTMHYAIAGQLRYPQCALFSRWWRWRVGVSTLGRSLDACVSSCLTASLAHFHGRAYIPCSDFPHPPSFGPYRRKQPTDKSPSPAYHTLIFHYLSLFFCYSLAHRCQRFYRKLCLCSIINRHIWIEGKYDLHDVLLSVNDSADSFWRDQSAFTLHKIVMNLCGTKIW